MTMVVQNKIALVGPWGSPTGQNWSLKIRGKITKISINQGDCIHSISFTSRDDDGNVFHSQTFGGSGGDRSEVELDIDGEEELKEISGTIGNVDSSNNAVVTSLSFSTNLNKFGPFGWGGRELGSSFSVPLQDASFVGFYGRSGDFLNAIGFYLQQKNTKMVLKAWGVEYSTHWSFECIGKLTKIRIWHGRFICAISFTSQAHDRTLHVSPKYGGSDGSYTEVDIDIDGGEELNCISGTIATYSNRLFVSSLSFSTGLNKFGPFGKGSEQNLGRSRFYGGYEFSLPITKARFGGFHGCAAAGIHSLGVYLHPT